MGSSKGRPDGGVSLQVSLKVLQDNPDLSQRELAQEVGLSLGQDHLLPEGAHRKRFIKASNFPQQPE